VGQLPVYSVSLWSSVYIDVQEGEVAIQLSLHAELDVGMHALEVFKEIIQFSWSIRPEHKCVINIMKQADDPVGCLVESKHRLPWACCCHL